MVYAPCTSPVSYLLPGGLSFLHDARWVDSIPSLAAQLHCSRAALLQLVDTCLTGCHGPRVLRVHESAAAGAIVMSASSLRNRAQPASLAGTAGAVFFVLHTACSQTCTVRDKTCAELNKGVSIANEVFLKKHLRFCMKKSFLCQNVSFEQSANDPARQKFCRANGYCAAGNGSGWDPRASLAVGARAVNGRIRLTTLQSSVQTPRMILILEMKRAPASEILTY